MGWQKQTRFPQTVQGVLEKALSLIFKTPISVCGAGRTDAGVHAIAQQAHFWCPVDPRKIRLKKALNGKITPSSLVVHKTWLAPQEFHALGSSIEKNYKYLILNRTEPSALRRNHVTHIPTPLSLKRLNELSQLIMGTHDFKSFQTSGTEVKTTLKTIQSAQWSQPSKDLLQFSISGPGFLKQMVRNIVGTQIHFVRNKLSNEEFLDILRAKNRQKAKDTAPAQGLYLYSVKYPDFIEKACEEF